MMESELMARLPLPLEHEPPANRASPFPAGRLLLVSAQDKQALSARLDQLATVVDQGRSALDDVAFTLATGRKALSHRSAVVLPEVGSPAEALRAKDGPHILRGQAKAGPGEVVMMFPGQGAQFLGMGRHLYQTSHRYRAIFDRCEELVRPRLDVSLRDLLLKSPGRDGATRATQLTQTAVAQPALFIVEYAIARLLGDFGVSPRAVFGHSIGEYAAACLAGVFSLEAAIEVVCERGRLMQSMPPGSMLAVKAEPDQVREFLVNGVDLAAHNAPGLTVISGPTALIEQVVSRASLKGIETRALHTSHAFHSHMMDPILEPFERVIERAGPRAPELPLISTMTGRPLTNAEATSSAYWAEQLRKPVQFATAATTACTSKSNVLLEVGPGVSLITFVAQLNDVAHRPRKLIETLGHAKSDLSSTDALLKSLGQLWIENVAVDLETLYEAQQRKLVRLPTYPYSRKRHSITPPRASGAPTSSDRSFPSPPVSSEAAANADPAESTQQRVLLELSQLLEARLGRSISDEELDLKLLELGFDSLALSQLAGRLKQTFNILVPVRQLFDSLGTPRSLADYLATNTSTVQLSKPPAKPSVSAPAPDRGDNGVAPRSGESGMAAQLAHIVERLSRIEAALNHSEVSAARLSSPPQEDFAPPGFSDGSLVRPLTKSQSEIWVATRIGGAEASIAYNECRAFLFAGNLDVEALENGIRELCQRHAALRQTFSDDGDSCITHPSINFQLTQTDLRSVDNEANKKAQFLSALRSQVETPFSLSTGPVFRGSLIRLHDEERVLVLCAHHVSVDGSSWEILIRELSEIYSAHVEGRPAQLAPAVDFAQYAELEERYRLSHLARVDTAFWLAHLKGQTEDLNLPSDRPRPAQRTFNATRLDQNLSPELVASVRAASARASCTAQTFLFSAFQILLHRLTGQLDIVCGVPTSGQMAAGLDPLVGHCVHVLPLRVSLDPKRSVAEHL
ncbi:MAG TPA: condensation domain-containing protein, partial [Polyangiaceae bacterium]|nr:condensation domain-containing protein [Polyangiaceae bacterium]